MSLNSVQSFVIDNCNGPTIENGLTMCACTRSPVPLHLRLVGIQRNMTSQLVQWLEISVRKV